MSCPDCAIPVGSVHLLTPEWAGCDECNADASSQFPRNAIHLGIRNGDHYFEYIAPFVCPGCGRKKTKLKRPCEGDNPNGIELPLLIQLPVPEEVKDEL